MQRTYNELMKRESSVGIIYEFLPINPVKHNELIMKAVNLFGETGLYLLIGKIESAGNDILQTTWFIQAMQKLCRVDPVKVSEFQIELLSHIRRSDLNAPSDQGVMLSSESLMGLSEFSMLPGGDKKDPIILLNRLTIAALEEYVVPFVAMLSESDITRNLMASLTTWLGNTAPTSTGSSGDQSTQDSSPQEVIEETRKKRVSRSGIFTKRQKS
ncbi:MAG: hypothetical protein KAT14_07475 [Candidatus Marinimicrobia bacterium]|nr:hypothetical protein [Candidatus Neomarinimicrobiota bacterium]